MPDRTCVAGMNAQRKSFRREGEDFRRRELVEATLTCIATLGMERTTVREIAIKAGVTAGLIRHYFSSKEELVLAAYSHYVGQMAAQSRQTVENASSDPLTRLAAFVRTNLSAPVVDQTNLSL
ncbi:MAG: TetR family transcriptional regulator, partial [Rhizobiaceae bacterium]